MISVSQPPCHLHPEAHWTPLPGAGHTFSPSLAHSKQQRTGVRPRMDVTSRNPSVKMLQSRVRPGRGPADGHMQSSGMDIHQPQLRLLSLDLLLCR